MPQRPNIVVPWLMATAALAAPAAAVLLFLMLRGALPSLEATLGCGIVVALVGGLTWRHLRSLNAIVDHADRLAAAQPAQAPDVSGGALTEALLAAVRRLDRAWQTRAEALRGAIAINESLLDSLPDPIILLNSQRQVLFSNAAVLQQLGASGMGRDLAHLIRDPRVLDSATAVLRGLGGREVRLEIVDPAERHFAVRIEPLREETAGGGTCVIAMVDLTAMMRVEQMRSDFIANASHELRTPLSSLIGFIETLRGPARDDVAAREQFLELMHQQAERMARLVRDLLSLSMIETTEHTPPSGAIDPGALLRGVCDLLRLQAQSRGITIELQVADNLPRIVGDADQLTQLFQNLVDNAIKYGPARQPVTITAESATEPSSSNAADNTAVRVTIADRGEGIPKEHLPRLTERFYRVDAARSRAVGGTGLGLAIVKHIVNRHRGRLRIESEIGQGTTVFVRLPAIPPAADTTAA